MKIVLWFFFLILRSYNFCCIPLSVARIVTNPLFCLCLVRSYFFPVALRYLFYFIPFSEIGLCVFSARQEFAEKTLPMLTAQCCFLLLRYSSRFLRLCLVLSVCFLCPQTVGDFFTFHNSKDHCTSFPLEIFLLLLSTSIDLLYVRLGSVLEDEKKRIVMSIPRWSRSPGYFLSLCWNANGFSCCCCWTLDSLFLATPPLKNLRMKVPESCYDPSRYMVSIPLKLGERKPYHRYAVGNVLHLCKAFPEASQQDC